MGINNICYKKKTLVVKGLRTTHTRYSHEKPFCILCQNAVLDTVTYKVPSQYQ